MALRYACNIRFRVQGSGFRVSGLDTLMALRHPCNSRSLSLQVLLLPQTNVIRCY
jgi:hypothetical protein